MINQCNTCGKIWECDPNGRKQCRIACTECAYCYAKRVNARLELVYEMNKDCYPFPPVMNFNPSKRGD